MTGDWLKARYADIAFNEELFTTLGEERTLSWNAGNYHGMIVVFIITIHALRTLIRGLEDNIFAKSCKSTVRFIHES